MEVQSKNKLQSIRPQLKAYIEAEIIPIYLNNDDGHQPDHAEHVIRRSMKFIEQFEGLDPEIMYVAAAYHDVCHVIDKDNHEVMAAEKFWQDQQMVEFFSEGQRKIIKETIADHRSSSAKAPCNDYSKILRSADCNISVDNALRRTHAYTIKYFPELTGDDVLKRGYEHIRGKFNSQDGYSKSYVDDPEYQKFREEIQEIIQDPGKFAERYRAVNGMPERWPAA